MISISPRKIGEMKEVAYQPDGVSIPEEDLAYMVVRNPGNNLTIFPKYRLGAEYPKTYGHFHVPDYPENYRVLFGRAGFLLQKMAGERVVGMQLKVVGAGEKFTVPAGWGHVAINLGDDYLITQDDHDPAHFENDYSLVKKMRGFAYYLVEDGGNWKAVPNPAYGEISALEVI
uniref:glucose-6-phosphate isomerase n=1 Tax=candidate division WWE3 bacterium TaxID=2053526 RepID=A0A831Z1B1_UNCKA